MCGPVQTQGSPNMYMEPTQTLWFFVVLKIYTEIYENRERVVFFTKYCAYFVCVRDSYNTDFWTCANLWFPWHVQTVRSFVVYEVRERVVFFLKFCKRNLDVVKQVGGYCILWFHFFRKKMTLLDDDLSNLTWCAYFIRAYTYKNKFGIN